MISMRDESIRKKLGRLSRRDLGRLLSSMSGAEAEELLWHWPTWARDSQLPPAGDWMIWLILAGRGFGKTRTGAEATRYVAERGIYSRIALVGQDPSDVRDVMIEGPAGILAVSPPHNRPRYERTRKRLTWPNGVVAHVFSGENPDSLRGPQHDFAWVDELAALAYPEETWSNLMLGLRLKGPRGEPPRAIATTTPRPIDTLRNLVADPMCFVTRGSTYENKGNLDPRFFSKIIKSLDGTRLGRQEIEAEILSDVDGAMWSSDCIDKCRVSKADVPDMQRIVVSIDPQGASGGAGETGIIVAGLGVDGHAYVLEDLSCSLRPNGWAARAVQAYEEYRADAIIAEDNNGGEMVSQTIISVSPTANIKTVHASKGKRARAEPVASLYESTKMRDAIVHHAGEFRALEKQMTSYTGLASEKSPDRLDALVWAVHDLLLSSDVAFV
jgi:phage terminase large subunit-like protein